MTGWPLVEAVVGCLLVFLAAVVLSRPTYRFSRFLLGIAVAAFAVGLIGVMDALI